MCLKPHKSKPPTWARQGSSWRFVSIPSGSKMDPTLYLVEADQGWKLFSVQPRNSMWKTYPINTNRNLRYFQVTSSRLHSTNICCWFYIFVAELFPTGRHTECNMCCAYEYGVGLATRLFWGGRGGSRVCPHKAHITLLALHHWITYITRHHYRHPHVPVLCMRTHRSIDRTSVSADATQTHTAATHSSQTATIYTCNLWYQDLVNNIACKN